MKESFFMKAALKVTASSPTTDVPLKCTRCSVLITKYNMENHWKEMHDKAVTTEADLPIITDAEKTWLAKFLK